MKIIAAFFFSLLTLCGFSSHVYAQSADIVQSERDYRFQFDLYRTAHSQYEVARSEFLESHTVKAEQEAYEAAKSAALSRAEVLRTYTRWLTLQLKAQSLWYPSATTVSEKLTNLENWLTTHKATLQSVGSPSAYETVQAEFKAHATENDKVFALGQIHLKLGQLSGLQSQAKNLYQPLFTVLDPQKNEIPEIEQGTAKVNQHMADFDTQVAAIQTYTGTIEAESYRIDQVYRTVSEKLEKLRTTQLTQMDIITELENRYGSR